MRIGRRPSRCGSARKIGCQLLPESYFSARSGPVSGTVSPRIRRDSKLDSAGIHGRARLTYDLSLWETAWVEFSRFVFLIFIGLDRFLCASPRQGLEPCVRASFQNEKRDIVVVVPEVLANFSTFSNVIVVKFLLWFLGTIFSDFFIIVFLPFLRILIILSSKLDLRHIQIS